MDMTKEALRRICVEHQLYRTPHLNDTLYANFKGFANLSGLHEYANLKALFLEGNVLDSIKDMPPLKHLRCLYLQQNSLWSLCGLDVLESLDTLNVSGNRLRKLDHLSGCQVLTTVIATNNLLQDKDSIQSLTECKSLQSLDLQNNQLNDPSILEVITQLPNLRCLYLKGNPVVSDIKNYRKTLISGIPTLTYLDDRPVFDLERKCAEAWSTGGMAAEREARARHKEEEAARDRANFEYMQAIRRAGFQKRRQRLERQGEGDPGLDDLSDTEWESSEDPPELIAARERLAAYTYRSGEEEPTDLAQARMDLANQGAAIGEGQWAVNNNESDGDIYLSTLKENQAALASDAANNAAAHDTKPKSCDQMDGKVTCMDSNCEVPPLERLDLEDLD